jgi:VWFA-related protein
MRLATLTAILLLGAYSLPGATKVLVTVVEQRSGKPITGLTAKDFNLLDDRTARPVQDVEFTKGTLDIMLLLDTSLVGGMVQPVAEDIVAQIEPTEQMAVVSFHSSADLIQDFTSSKELLLRSLSTVKYGNAPRVLDALYAAIDGGFRGSGFRRIILLLTTGFEGPSRTSERDVIRLARRNGVSVFPIYITGGAKSLFENLARQTGGASFNLRDLRRAGIKQPGPRIFEVARGHYTLTVSGNLSLGDRVKVEVKTSERTFVSALPLD